ncbi:sulfur carrier protein ThiS [Algirhabdus cladophorae]|uniref:sulfur carrier protein ThiS n=1 Tax=Algirhabdus cladophorae TaxID=3377108 RepID=UPI003B8495AE
MNVQLNGEGHTTTATTLADLLIEQGYKGAKLATAVNGDFVPAAMRATHEIKPGDQIEVLAPMQGG